MIRGLTGDDAPRLAELELLLFSGDNPWSAADFRAEISQPYCIYLGIEHEGALVAYAGLAKMGPATDPEFEIHTIGVDPKMQRRGFARVLMEHLCAEADRFAGPIFLEVRTDNVPAINLYERFGFQTIGVRKRYYQPSGADAFTMVRPARLLEQAQQHEGDEL
ncbi:ribosomal protein S18-alanine N-acetyltransferase [Corynebacterium gerontici]|uniref:Ribosomal-protein-alanine N-acetyltransferase n=1 Tax=Corynebacterium gerontici TaxID=2079234 RepID=A0A3G6J2U6_9CORY|nr:ribosomal protein S18-alanine N-acetyltransferase [Corynebacterium gerontici]AZA12033.1 ribosomal-protein-alanine N-acetyltransferase [Corynebacterium gerontici]